MYSIRGFLGFIVFGMFIPDTFAQVRDAVSFQREYTTEDFLYKSKPKAQKNPKGMEFDHTGKLLFVANLYGVTNKKANVTVIDAETQTVIKNINTPNGVGYRRGAYHANGTVEVAITPDNEFALVTRLQGCQKNGRHCNGGIPSEVSTGGMLNVIRISDLQPVLYIPTNGQGSKIIGMKPNSTKVYITNWFTNNVSVVDIGEAYKMYPGQGAKYYPQGFKKTIRFPKKAIPRGLSFSSQGRYMYVLGFGSGRLYIVSTESDRIIGETPKTGYKINFRHMSVSKDETVAFFSHMKGNGISRISMTYMAEVAQKLDTGYFSRVPSNFWKKAFIPWETSGGKRKNILKMTDYGNDHPEIPGRHYKRADPNTIILDPSNNCYLYVSFRSGSMTGSSALTHGKVDIVDVCNDRRVISLYAGGGPTALAVTQDGGTLASSAFFDNRIWFYDSRGIKDEYEQIYGEPVWR